MDAPAAASPWFASNFIEVVQDLYISRYLSASGFVILLYDSLLLLPVEVSFLKKSKQSFKWIFILNKYIVIVSLVFISVATSGIGGLTLSDKFCKGALAIPTILGSLSIGIVSILAILRITALANLRRYLYLLAPLTVIIFLAALGTVVFTLVKVVGTIQYSSDFMICIVGGNTRDVAVSVVLPLVLDTSVLAVTLKHAFSKPHDNLRGRLDTLANNGFGHFFVIFICRLFCLLIIAIAPPSLLLAGVIFAWPFIAAVLSRLVITLRSQAQRQQSNGHHTSSLSHSRIHSIHSTGAEPYLSEEDLEMDVNPGPRSFESETAGKLGINISQPYHQGPQDAFHDYNGFNELEEYRTNTESEGTPRLGYTPMPMKDTGDLEREGDEDADTKESPTGENGVNLQPLSFRGASSVWR